MKSFEVLIRLDAGTRVGLGHLRRCLALAQAFRREGFRKIGFLTRDPVFVREWTGSGFDVVALHSHRMSEEIPEIRRLFSEHRPSLYMIDHYEYQPGHVEALRDLISRSAYVDDRARWSRYPVDALINHNVDAFRLPYPRRGPKLFLGTRYSLMSEEIVKLRNRREIFSGLRIFMTLGGAADPRALGTLLAAFKMIREKIPDAEASLAAGVLWKKRIHPGFGVHQVPPHQLAGAMSRCNLAVSSSGVTSYELACLGIPAVLVTAADNQKNICREMARRGCVLNGGWISKVKAFSLAGKVLKLWQDPAARRKMSQTGMRLIPGDGPLKLVRELKRSFFS